LSTVRPILDEEYRGTLLGEFLEDDCLDELRQLSADFGARPYRVFMIRTRWTGGKRGRGVEQVFSEEEILPTPKIETVASVNLQMLDIGVDEQGALSISEISPRYTENQLLGRNGDGTEIPENETFSWEVRLSRGGPDQNKLRRYTVKGVPDYRPTELQWKVSLIRAGSDRQSDGAPR
jgi:hypothetical protein